MIGIGIATELEWQATLDYFEKNNSIENTLKVMRKIFSDYIIKFL